MSGFQTAPDPQGSARDNVDGDEPTDPNNLETLTLDSDSAENHWNAWHRLALKSLDPNPFFGPEFLVPFLRNMNQTNVSLYVIRSRKTGHWLMAAPMASRKLGLFVPAATSLATEYGPLGVPLLSPQAPAPTIPAFLSLANKATGKPLIAFPYMPLDSHTAQALQAAPGWTARIGSQSHRAAHGNELEGEEQFSRAYSGKRRKELSRLLRRLSAHGEVTFESHIGTDALDQFERFLDLEASGWKGKRGSALLSQNSTACFARDMITGREASNGIRIDALRVAGQPIAMLLIMLEADQAFSWKIAYDQDFSRYSPGAHITLFAFERNLSDPTIISADSLAIPGHPMIEPLWRGRLRYGTLFCAKSVSGRLLQAAAKYDQSLEQDIRKIARKILRRPS
ncbi:GNAT family N-acetyltransferase [Roseibium algae]|uniref:GNAT family N-acetyltransferase n=1 Tax=Roseibium algae TaxID=3123038 RepID=A0ABU8TNX4_9HYPH